MDFEDSFAEVLDKMAVQHSIGGAQASFRTVDDIVFTIEPEYLNDDELDHELRIRTLPVSGDRRDKTKRIRDAIKNEDENQGAFGFAIVGTPTTELNYAQGAIERLQYFLESVNRETETQQRFMSIFIHVEGRLKRVNIRENVDESNRAFGLLERLYELHAIFVQNRKRSPPAVTMRRQQNVAFQPIGVDEIESQLVQRLNLELPQVTNRRRIETTSRPHSYAGSTEPSAPIHVTQIDNVTENHNVNNLKRKSE